MRGHLIISRSAFLHWRDEAAFFHVNVLRDEYFFGGILDLKMTAEW